MTPQRIGAMTLFLVALAAILAPVVSPYVYDEIDLASIKLSPGASHWMGTDELGRDLATRVFVGARLSLTIGLVGAPGDTLIDARSISS